MNELPTTSCRSYFFLSSEKHDHYLRIHAVTEDAEGYSLSIDSDQHDTGSLYRIGAALAAPGWLVKSSEVKTQEESIIHLDAYLVPMPGSPGLNESSINQFFQNLGSMLVDGVSVVDFLGERHLAPGGHHQARGFADLTYDNGRVVIEVRTRPDPFTLISIFQSFYLMDVNVKEGTIRTHPDQIWEIRFVVATDDFRYHNPEFRKRLKEELLAAI